MTEDRQPEIQDIEDQIEEDAEDSSDLEERLEEAERERDQFRTLALRYKADLENYKKRAASDCRLKSGVTMTQSQPSSADAPSPSAVGMLAASSVGFCSSRLR